MEKLINEIIQYIIPVLLLGVVKIFSPINKAIGIEDYGARVKARLKNNLSIIVVFVIAIMVLGTYKKWISDDLDNNVEDIVYLGTAYFLIGMIIFIKCIIMGADKFIKKTTKGLDEYQKNFEWEKTRVGFYISISFLLTGTAAYINDILVAIVFSIAIIYLGVIVLILFDYEADRALLYCNSSGGKIYLYRTIDNDRMLCGTEKNALSCKSYIIKNKNDVFNEELYVVDKEDKGRKSEEIITKNDRKIEKIVELVTKYKNSFSISIVIAAIIIGVLLYVKEKVEIVNIIIGIAIVLTMAAIIRFVERLIMEVKKRVEWIRNRIILIIVETCILISVLRVCLGNKIYPLEYILHFIILSLGLMTIIYKTGKMNS